MIILPDIISPGLEILFVGFNPSLRSAEIGHHFAGANNRFWKVMYMSNITSLQLNTENDQRLLEYSCGLTNIVERPTKSAAEITKKEYLAGAYILREKIKKNQPLQSCVM